MNRLPCVSLLAFALLMVLSVDRNLHAQEPKAPAGKVEEPKMTIEKLAEENRKTAKELTNLRKSLEEAKTATSEAKTEGTRRGDTAWLLISSALVMLMVPGLAFFYGGMVRRKNVLATMMQSYASLAIVGLFWVVVGYSLAFGPSVFKINFLGVTEGGIFGWSWNLFCLQGVKTDDYLPGYNIPVYAHVMFQGMFAIITPALISGAIAERIRFWPFTIFVLLWVTFVYCPLAHMVWGMDFFTSAPLDAKKGSGGSSIGLLGKMGALDFAGGTVVHIAAGVAGLACCLVLRRRHGYPEHAMHPNSMVLTLLGTALLWFGWFGFNGGSSLTSDKLGVSAFAATQAAAAAAGLSWMLVEWIFKGKPTALGLASGIVAGLVAITPASGFVYIKGAIAIGLMAGIVCYCAVQLKTYFGYDDSLDAFGVHAVGGFLGAVLTGLFCYAAINGAGAEGFFAMRGQQARVEVLEKQIPGMEVDLFDLGAELEKLKKPIDDAQGPLEEIQKLLSDATEKEIALRSELRKAEPGSLDAKTTAEDLAVIAVSIEELTPAMEAQRKLLEDAVDAQATVKEQFNRTQEHLTGLKKEHDDLKKAMKEQAEKGKTPLSQFFIQIKAATFALLLSFILSLALASFVQAVTLGNFTTSAENETEGLDQTEHGEVGFDFGTTIDTVPGGSAEPRSAKLPPGKLKRFDVVVEGVENGGLIKAWSELCQPTNTPIDADFKAVYPYVTTVQGNRFRFRGGDPKLLSEHLLKLFQRKLGKSLKVRLIEE